MFRFLYAKVFCRPYTIIKKHRARTRLAKLEEESGMNVTRVNASGWTIDDNNNDNSNKKPTTNTLINAHVDDEDEQRRNKRVTVPLTITMLIIALYIWAGALLFHRFEDWSMTEAGYFCFITLGMTMRIC